MAAPTVTLQKGTEFMIRVDISNIWGQVSLPDLLSIEKEVSEAHSTLMERTGPGSDYLGWLDLPTEHPTEEMLRIQAAAERIRSNSDVLLVIGIGGSYLGPRAAMELTEMRHTLQYCQELAYPEKLHDRNPELPEASSLNLHENHQERQKQASPVEVHRIWRYPASSVSR